MQRVRMTGYNNSPPAQILGQIAERCWTFPSPPVSTRQKSPSGTIGSTRKTSHPTAPEKMVGPARFELATSCTPCKRATRLRYGPNNGMKEGGGRDEGKPLPSHTSAPSNPWVLARSVIRPEDRLAGRLADQCLRMESEFGMTPSNRSRISTDDSAIPTGNGFMANLLRKQGAYDRNE